MSFNLPGSGGVRLSSPRVRLENYKRSEKKKEKRPKKHRLQLLPRWSPPEGLEPFAFTIHQRLHSFRGPRQTAGRRSGSQLPRPTWNCDSSDTADPTYGGAGELRAEPKGGVKSLNLVSYRRGAGEKEEQPQKIPADRLRLNY